MKVNNRIAFITLLILLSIQQGYTQTQVVLIKVFNQKLEPFKNEEISINGGPFLLVDKNGQLFKELESNDLPPTSIALKNAAYEVGTWSYSKGKLEIVVRPKTSQTVHIQVFHEKSPATNLPLIYQRKLQGTTDLHGKLSFEIPLHGIVEKSQFELEGFDIVTMETLPEKTYTLHIRSAAPSSANQAEPHSGTTQPTARLQSKILNRLDSIDNFSELYDLFKQLELSKLDKDVQQRINEKFSELITQTGLREGNQPGYTKMITDTSRIKDDVINLLKQARSEHSHLDEQRREFDRSVQTIQSKLAEENQNLNEAERNQLVRDLEDLENILRQNQQFFTENHDYYTNLLYLIKEKFFDISNLENQLSASETKRQAQEKQFRERMILISSLVVVFGILLVLLMRSEKRLRKVNQRISEMNENLEEIVMQRTRMLTLANKELDTFLYRASHDLRSPVRSILGLCNIATQVANPESQDLLDKVSGTVMIMDKLLKKLSVISEINQPSGYSEIKIKTSILTIIDKFANTIDQNKVDIRIQCDDHLSFYTYPNLFEVVLSNIIENALFYSLIKNTSNAIIEIEAKKVYEHIQIVITDNGIGIDNEIKSRLFDMFFKGNENSKGNGLGLYIVLKSIQALNGDVEVESKPGQYSKFTVTLPKGKIDKTLKLDRTEYAVTI